MTLQSICMHANVWYLDLKVWTGLDLEPSVSHNHKLQPMFCLNNNNTSLYPGHVQQPNSRATVWPLQIIDRTWLIFLFRLLSNEVTSKEVVIGPLMSWECALPWPWVLNFSNDGILSCSNPCLVSNIPQSHAHIIQVHNKNWHTYKDHMWQGSILNRCCPINLA